MPATHAQIARQLVAQLIPGAFAHACLPAVQHDDFTHLEAMLPGVRFAIRKVGGDEWELVGTCTDGSAVIWRVGA
jgi:hypothetical protein